jgi:hypothetical protein
MRRQYARFLLAALSVLLMACNLAGTSPTAAPEEGTVQVYRTQEAAATVAALPTAIATQFILPHTPTPSYPPEPISDTYAVEDERLIGAYIVTLWHNTAADALGFDNIVTIASAAGGQTLVQLDLVSGFRDYTGHDITGEGDPDLVLERYTGGAHCCFSVIVYNLGPTPTKVLETRESNCSGRFEDLDGDSVPEFITCDDLFAYVYCPYAASPMVQVILRYEPGRGYVPASPHFAQLYAEVIVQHTGLAEGATAEGMGEWDQTTKCGVLPLVLDYLYTGRADRAWEEFSRLYAYPDALLFWAEIVRAVSESSLYVAAGPSPDVPLPANYMLQLLTSCGPDWQYVGLLTEGMGRCDRAAPQRDIYWLDAQLRGIGLLSEGEAIQLSPPGCTTDCRLDVVRHTDGARVASIRLDTTMGFPGAVYRVNGVESAHWRLRGDLRWEQVSP